MTSNAPNQLNNSPTPMRTIKTVVVLAILVVVVYVAYGRYQTHAHDNNGFYNSISNDDNISQRSKQTTGAVMPNSDREGGIPDARPSDTNPVSQ